MSDADSAWCPHCGIRAAGTVEVDLLFGYRTWKERTFPQSYCRQCRKKKR